MRHLNDGYCDDDGFDISDSREVELTTDRLMDFLQSEPPKIIGSMPVRATDVYDPQFFASKADQATYDLDEEGDPLPVYSLSERSVNGRYHDTLIEGFAMESADEDFNDVSEVHAIINPTGFQGW